MNDFVNNVLTELQTNPNTKDNNLVKLVVESANKSIMSNESSQLIYDQLKRGLTTVNEQAKIAELEAILSQFEKLEDTDDSKIEKLGRIGNLSEKIKSIKESNAYSNPIIADKVNIYEAKISNTPAEFNLYPSFVEDFKSHAIEESVKQAVDSISNVLESNSAKFEIMYAVSMMEGRNASLYAGISEDLKSMLVNESFTADVIKIKHGSTNLPLVNSLINSLKIIESKSNEDFTIGTGDANTSVRNVICPAIKSAKKSITTFIDGRFIRITESDKLNGSEIEVHAKSNGYSISTINPDWVKEKHSQFYKVCESYAKLGFKLSENYQGVESSNISKFNIGLVVNESKDLDLYINGSKVEDAKSVNITEALVMLDDSTKSFAKTILENTSMILNLGFIKSVVNDRTLSESTVFNLGENYFICNMLNEAEREWSANNEYQMYEHFITNFNYDISPIFGTKINEQASEIKSIQERKAEILKNIEKLEESSTKLSNTSNSEAVDPSNAAKLDELKSSINSSIELLKEEFIKLEVSEKKKSKPDFLDVDGDGDTKEDMKEAAKDKKKKEEK